MKRSCRWGFLCLNIPLLSIFLIFLPSLEAQAESKKTYFNKINNQLMLDRAIASSPPVSTSAPNLLAQGVTRVTGVEVKQTNRGLEVILKTVAGGQRLVPLILPEGNKLVIDILDANLAFGIRNGVTKANPAPGIKAIALTKVDASSLRLTITGEKQAPRAEVVSSRQNLVLSINPQRTTAQTKPEQEIEIIATGEGTTDNYYVPDASSGTRTDTPIRDIPQSIQVIPQEILEDQQVIRLDEALSNVSGTAFGGALGNTGLNFNIRGFDETPVLLDGFRQFGSVSLGSPEIANLDRVEVLKGPASILYGEVQPGGGN